LALRYPDDTIWYVRASASDGKDVSEGSAVAIRLQKRGEPKTAKTYLLTCGHVVRGTFPGERTIRAWPPDVAYNDRQARTLKVDANFKELSAGELSPAERPNAADDWVILQICDAQATMAAPTVRKWADDPLSGNFRIWGYVGGEDSFPQDKVIPTRTADTFPLRDASHGAVYFVGDGTRPGISGGGVFKEEDIQFGGIHRARFNDTMQVCAVSSLHIVRRLYELGYEAIPFLPDAYLPLKRALGVATTPSAPAQLFVGSSLPQVEASAKLSWPQILFSFKGRLSRMRFLIGFISTVAFVAVLFVAAALTIEPFFQAAQSQTEDFTTTLPELLERRLLLVVVISSWWPALALVLKRLHDLGQGWKLLLVFAALDVLWASLHLLNKDELAQPIAGVDLGLTFMLALIRGTTGPNRYGPDPLGGTPDLTKR
jgi:uncharacterized membrane protein YhaH (DUF805 family)